MNQIHVPNIIDDILPYRSFLFLKSGGQLQSEDHPVAQPHFTTHIQPVLPSISSHLADSDTLAVVKFPHRPVQRLLVEQHQNHIEFPQSIGSHAPTPPESCLRCYISYSIDFACQQLAVQFGTSKGFKKMDLLPYVLNDDRLLSQRSRPLSSPSSPPPEAYRSLTTHIFETFDPDRSNLKTWTVLLVRHDKLLNQALLEYGVYLASDWAILKDSTELQIREIFGVFYRWTSHEVEQAVLVLEAYRDVYGGDRLDQGTSGRCNPPISSQLKRMIDYLQAEYPEQQSLIPAVEHFFSRLQTLAHYLRGYRIYTRQHSVPSQSMDDPNAKAVIDQAEMGQAALGLEDDTQRFLREYRQDLTDSLDMAIAHVVEQKVAKLSKGKRDRDRLFLKGLRLLCRGLTMAAIAPQLGYKRQDNVTYLLDLQGLRDAIRHRMLNQLRVRILELASSFTAPEQLYKLDQHLDAVLAEETLELMNEAGREILRPRHSRLDEAGREIHRPLKSYFFQRLNHYLDNR